MMTPRTNPDLIPGAPWWANFAIKFGAFGVLAFLLWQNNQQTSDTSKALVASNAGTINRMPEIAAQMVTVASEIKDDNRANSEFMRQHTAASVAARRDMDVKLAAIDARLATVMQELVSIRSEQQKTYQLFIDALQRLGGGEKNSQPPALNNGGE